MSSLSGKVVVFTGKLSKTRAECKSLAIAAGATPAGSVSGNTDILVGSGKGKKFDTAAEKGIAIWDEARFFAACNGGSDGATKSEPPISKMDIVKNEEDAAEDLASIERDTGLANLTVPQLKKLLKARGLKVSGKKALLVSRLQEFVSVISTPDSDGGAAPAPKKASKKNKAPPAAAKQPKAKKCKTSTAAAAPAASAAAPSSGGDAGPRRGGRVDREVPGGSQYSIHDEFHIKLNQTNIKNNNNKFYIIQLLEGPKGYALWTRWGRVGESGQNALKPGLNEATGIKEFKKKFKAKTKNAWQDGGWSDRDAFVKHDKKYQLVDVEEDGDDGDADGDQSLGRLSQSQIEQGMEVLADLERVLKGEEGGDFEQLSSQYYSLIPTKSGRSRPPLLNEMVLLKTKQELLKFWLRMGFEEVQELDAGLTPISGVMDIALPKSLRNTAVKLGVNMFEIQKCENKGKELEARQAGGPEMNMPASLYAAIMLYTGNSIYKDLNRMLRNENRRALKKYFQYLRLLLEAFHYLPSRNCSLYRGLSNVDLHDSYTVGKKVTWWGVSSCTSDVSVAKNFLNGCGGKGTLLTVQAKSACEISSLSQYSKEAESLLPPGTVFEVVSRRREGKLTLITVKEVGCMLD